MKKRPVGITILAALSLVGAAQYTVFSVLALTNMELMARILRGLSPGGSGPADVHLGMGRFLPVYYLLSAALSVWMAWALWKLQNWVRLLTLGAIAVSFVFVLTTVRGVVADGSATALGLLGLRVGLCAFFAWYMLSRRIREAFSR